MSWLRFENEVVSKLESGAIKSPEEFAKFFTKKYDECIKNGEDLVTKNKVNKGNVELMEELIKLALMSQAAAKNDSIFDKVYNAFGNAVIAYWTGSTLNPMLTPLQPALGSNYNIGATAITTTIPGTWPQVAVPPPKSPRKFIQQFIAFAKIHLTSVGGICNTTSAYTIYNVILPGTLAWLGYKVPDKGIGDVVIGLYSNMLFGGKKVVYPGELSHKGQSGWQSGNAYDIVGEIGTSCYSPIEGFIEKKNDYGPKVIEKDGKRLFGAGVTIRGLDGRKVYMAHMMNVPPGLMEGMPIPKGGYVGQIMLFPSDPTYNHLHIGFSEGTKYEDYIMLDQKGTFK